MTFKKFIIILCAVFILSILLINFTSPQSDIVTKIKFTPEYTSFAGGESLFVEIFLIQLGDKERRDVRVVAYLQDSMGQILSMEEQTIALEAQSSTVATLSIPKEISEGLSKVVAQIYDLDSGALVSSASRTVLVEKEVKFTRFDYVALEIILLIFLIISLIILIIVLYKRSKYLERHIAEHHKVDAHDVIDYDGSSIRRKKK